MGSGNRLKRFKNLFKGKDEPSTTSSPANDPQSVADPGPSTAPKPSPAQGSLPPNPTTNPKQIKLQAQLWNEAYDNLRDSGSKHITEYEEILVSELKKDNPDAGSVTIGTSHEERWLQMQRLVEIGLAKTEKEAKIYEKVNDGLELFGTVRALVEPAVSAVPQAAIPWVGVCFILEVISNPAKQPGVHREGLQYVLSRVDWYWNLAELLLEDNLEPKESTEKTPLSNLRDGLKAHMLDLYQKFLSYLIESVCYFHKNRGIAFLKSVVDIDHWSGKITAIKAAEQGFEKNSKQYNSTEARERLSSLIINVKSIESALERQTRQQLKLYEDQSNKTCLQALYTTNPLDDKKRIEAAKGGLLSHCYSWIFLTEGFQTWQQDPDRRILWIKGDPGKGKTMLLCGIIDRLDEIAPNHISCFFCQATENHENHAMSVLRGLIWSLICQHPALVSHVRSRFDSAGEKAFTGPNTWQILSEILRRMILDDNNHVPEGTTIVIDALDECTHENEKLLELIVELCADENSQVRWIVSSRNWVEFEDAFMVDLIASQRIVLPLENNKGIEEAISLAVNQFIKYKLQELGKKKHTTISTEVHDLFVEKSRSTFLWVALASERLFDKDIEAWQILDTLKGLPSGLKELYQRMMQDVKESSHLPQCKDILTVAALAHRPMSLAELSSSAQSLSRFSDNLDNLRRLVLRCKGFLVAPGDMVLFVHQSAKDYLLEDEFARKCVWEANNKDLMSEKVSRSHQAMALTMMETMKKVLRYDIYDLKRLGTSVASFQREGSSDPLAPIEYACCYWADHILLLDDESARATVAFFRECFLYWLEACSLLGKVSTAVLAIHRLQNLVLGMDYGELISLLSDANRFTLYFKPAIKVFPLQTYTSGLLFSPKHSFIRQSFAQHALETLWLDLPILDDWNACVQTLEGHTSTVSNMAFSRNGQWLASASEDCTIRIWDVATGVCLQTLESPYADVHAVSFSPDSSCLVSASEDCSIKFWDTISDKFRKTQTVETGSNVVTGLMFSPDGKWLASWSRSSRPVVDIRDAKTGDCIYSITLEERLPLGSEIRFSFSSDSQRILVGSENPGVRDIAGRSWINHPEIHPDRLLTSAFSSEGTWVAHSYGEYGHSIWSISEAGSTRIAKILKEDGYALPSSGQHQAGQLLPTSQRPSAISDDGKQIATCTENPFRLAIVDATTGAVACADPQTPRWAGNDLPKAMSWSADSQWLAVGGVEGHGQIKIWHPGSIESGSNIETIRKRIHAMTFSADGQRFVCGSENGIVEIQDMARRGKSLLTLEAHDSRVLAVIFSPSGNMLATQCARLVKIWNIETTGECLHTFEAGQIDLRFTTYMYYWTMAFSSDESQFAFTKGEHNIEIHDLTDQSTYQLEMENVLSLAFSPDGLSLAAGDNGGNVKIWDLRTKDAQELTLKSDGWSLAIAFSTDGKLLANATSGGSVYIWQMPAGNCPLKLEAEWPTQQLSFSPDSTSLITQFGRLIPEYWPSESSIQDDNALDEPAEVPFVIKGYGIGSDGAWLAKDGEDFVWLPPEHRQSAELERSAVVSDSVIVIRNSSKHLLMYAFNS
ncbi:hypothetical protein ACHAPU_011274 [Fusarium lateritium]